VHGEGVAECVWEEKKLTHVTLRHMENEL